MRRFVFALAFALLAAPVTRGLAADAPGCLSGGETRQSLSAGQAVAPAEMILAARRAVPEADIMRASLCRAASGLVYNLLALRRDGRLVHVTIEAASGRVISLR